MFSPKFVVQTSKYFVWKRNDGYVSVSRGAHPQNDGRSTFTPLKTFDAWNRDLLDYLEAQRRLSEQTRILK